MKNIPIRIETHQMQINHGGATQLKADFIIKYYADETIKTLLIIEHNDFRTFDLIKICENKQLTITNVLVDSVGKCFSKIYGLPYNGLGGTIRDAFQIVWDFYNCF